MKTLGLLRNVIYETLTLKRESEEETRTKLFQKLGISMTEAVMKHGVSIIQSQIVIDQRVIFNLVKLLQILDTESQDDIDEPLQKVVSNFVDRRIPFKDFVDQIKKEYIREAIRQSASMSDAAIRLGLERTKLSKLKKILSIETRPEPKQLTVL